MILTDTDYRKMAEQIEEGSSFVEYEKGDETLFFDYIYESDGYREDDNRCGYEKGTGAFVETYRMLSIGNVELYDQEGRKHDFFVDERRLQKLIA